MKRIINIIILLGALSFGLSCSKTPELVNHEESIESSSTDGINTTKAESGPTEDCGCNHDGTGPCEGKGEGCGMKDGQGKGEGKGEGCINKDGQGKGDGKGEGCGNKDGQGKGDGKGEGCGKRDGSCQNTDNE